MVCAETSILEELDLTHTVKMSATGIVAFFSLLSACSAGAHDGVGGLLSMLSAMRRVYSISVATTKTKDINIIDSS